MLTKLQVLDSELQELQVNTVMDSCFTKRWELVDELSDF